MKFDGSAILHDRRHFAELPTIAASNARMALMQMLGAAHWERHGKVRFARILRREAQKSIEHAAFWLAIESRHPTPTRTAVTRRTLH